MRKRCKVAFTYRLYPSEIFPRLYCVPLIRRPRSDGRKRRTFLRVVFTLAFISANTWSEPEHEARCAGRRKATIRSVSEPSWSLHPPPYTPGVGSPAVFRPFHARIPLDSLDSVYHSRTRTYGQYHSRCNLYSHFLACYSPSPPSRWVTTSSGTIAAQTSSMTSRGTHSGSFTVPGITSLCAFVLSTVDRRYLFLQLRGQG